MDGSLANEACCGACAHAAEVKRAGGAPPNPNAPLRFHMGPDGAPIGAMLILRERDLPEVARPILEAETVIGRTPPADVVVEITALSRRQCCFRFTPEGQVTIADLNSACGTFVNGEPIGYGGARALRMGDVVYVANLTMEIRPLLRP